MLLSEGKTTKYEANDVSYEHSQGYQQHNRICYTFLFSARAKGGPQLAKSEYEEYRNCTMLTRRHMYAIVQNVPSRGRCDALYHYLLEKGNVSENADGNTKHNVRRFASRFVSKFDSLFNSCQRKKERFERLYQSWLDHAPEGLEINIMVDDQSINVSSAQAQLLIDAVKEQNATLNDFENQDENSNLPDTSQESRFKEESDRLGVASEKVKRKRGRPTSDFQNSCERAKLVKTEQLRLRTDKDELFYATDKVLRAHGFHAAAREFRNIVEVPEAYEAKRRPPEEPCSAEEGLALLLDLNASKREYCALRDIAVSKNSILVPSYECISNAKMECYPSGMLFTETSATVQLQALLDHTARRLVILNDDVIEKMPTDDAKVTLLCKYGMDGSSGHGLYKQGFEDSTIEVGTDGNIFLCCVVPLRLSVEGHGSIWENSRPSSTLFCRPLRFIFSKETASVTKKIYESINKEIGELKSTVSFLKSGKSVEIGHSVKLTMVDVKVVNTLCDTGSQTCFVCKATPSIMNDIDEVRKRPVSEKSFTFGISPLHAKMRCFDALLHLAYKLDVQKHTVRSEEEKEVVLARKLIIQGRFKNEMNLMVDLPRPGGSGNSNDGNTARRFFDSPLLGAEILGLDTELVHRLAVLNNVLSSNHKVSASAYEEYALETAKLYVKYYDWYPMTPTVHKILIHGADFIRRTDIPLGRLSEEAQESMNKILRNYREKYARKCSRTATNEDVMKRMMLWSDPVVSTHRIRKSSPSRYHTDEDEIRLLEPRP